MELVGAEGNINAPIRPTPVGMPEYLEVVQDALVAFFKVGYQKYYEVGGSDANILKFINKTLKDNNAIVAGGFLLKAIHRYDVGNVDIDIYVPCKNLSRFNKTMLKLSDTTILRQYNASTYCRSFLRMNGIRSVQGFYRPSTPAHRRYTEKHIMDIMAVRNARSPLEVVQNFDLTFCQVWYDGENLMATHPDHIWNKKGFLQKDYIPLLIRGNLFLKRRMQKYIARGFSIEPETNHIIITPNMFSNYGNIRCPKIERNESYYKRWYSRALFRFIIYKKYQIYSKTIRDNKDVLFNIFDISHRSSDKYITVSQIQLNKPDADMDSLEPSDGYDSDDFDIYNKETYYPIVDNFSIEIPILKRVDWSAQDKQTKIWKCIRFFIEDFYTIKPNVSAFGSNIFYNSRGIEFTMEKKVDIVYKMMNDPSIDREHGFLHFDTYADTLKKYSSRKGTCAITLDDDVDVYDLHNHNLDQAVSINGLKQHLDTLIGERDKSEIPCYLAGCTWPLRPTEYRAIINYSYYNNFMKPIPIPLPPPDALLGTQGLGDNPGDAETKIDLIELLRNAPSDAGGWKNIYHHVMCPFCLSYISRDAGCTYVVHPNPDALPGALAPYCKPQNIIKDIRDKYVAAAGGGRLEVCAECGRACVGHQHFDLNDPPGLEPHHLTATGNPDYARCDGGGRLEQIARIVAVRHAVKGAGDMDAKDLRVVAGLAAESAGTASDPDIMLQATRILAKAVADRSEANLNIEHEGGKRRVEKICKHGYDILSSKVRKTRKFRGKKSKGTRKN